MKFNFTSKTIAATLLLASFVGAQGLQAQSRGPVIWDIDIIDAKVERIAAGESFAFYDKLKSEADSLVTVAVNPSVMAKPAPAISGDMHDYMSLSRYWWPDPKVADGIPYVRLDGRSNPELRQYDRNRLGELASSVETLALVYYISGEQKYADKAISRLRTWFIDPETKMNPNFQYAQVRKGYRYDNGMHSGVLDGYSFVSMLDAVSLLEAKGALAEDVAEGLHVWFGELSEWMLTSDNGIEESNTGNNHAVVYDVQTIRYAMYGGRDDLAQKVINEFPARRLETQIDSEGKMPEELARTNAFGYTSFNLTHMIDVCDMAAFYDIDIYPSADGSIERAIEWIIPYALDEESFPYSQIGGWEGPYRSLARLIWRAASYSKTDEYKAFYNENKATPESPIFEFLYVD